MILISHNKYKYTTEKRKSENKHQNNLSSSSTQLFLVTDSMIAVVWTGLFFLQSFHCYCWKCALRVVQYLADAWFSVLH